MTETLRFVPLIAGTEQAEEKANRIFAEHKKLGRKCEKCKAKLRAGNPGPWCSPCDRAWAKQDENLGRMLPAPDPETLPWWFNSEHMNGKDEAGKKKSNRLLPGLKREMDARCWGLINLSQKSGVRLTRIKEWYGGDAKASKKSAEMIAGLLGCAVEDLWRA